MNVKEQREASKGNSIRKNGSKNTNNGRIECLFRLNTRESFKRRSHKEHSK